MPPSCRRISQFYYAHQQVVSENLDGSPPSFASRLPPTWNKSHPTPPTDQLACQIDPKASRSEMVLQRSVVRWQACVQDHFGRTLSFTYALPAARWRRRQHRRQAVVADRQRRPAGDARLRRVGQPVGADLARRDDEPVPVRERGLPERLDRHPERLWHPPGDLRVRRRRLRRLRHDGRRHAAVRRGPAAAQSRRRSGHRRDHDSHGDNAERAAAAWDASLRTPE